MNTKHAIIYVRVSDSHQVSGTSLEFQEQECSKYCERNGMEVAAVFREEGESAKDLSLNNRQEFLRALEFCRKNKGKVGNFVVLRVDRFARSTEDHFAVRKLLLDSGVTLHSVTEAIGNTPTEKFIETVLAGAAEYDNAIRKRRCIDGMMSKIRQGLFPWHPPLGYVCEHFKKRGEKKTSPDRPDAKVFPIVRRALREYAKGLCSQRELSRKLDVWGLGEIRATKTYPQLVDRMLGHNLKFYAGVLVNPWTGEEHKGVHTPMLTSEEYERIVLVRSGKAFTIKRNIHNPEFPLRRLVLCGTCSRPFTGSVSRGNGGKYAYYHCVQQDCVFYGKGIPKALLEEEFMRYLKTITPGKRFWALLEATVVRMWNDRQGENEASLKRREGAVQSLEERRNRVFDMREDGSYTKEEFQQRRDTVESELAEARNRLASRRGDDFDPVVTLKYAAEFITAWGSQWLELVPEWRSRFQYLVFPDRIPYDRDSGFGTAKLGSIYELNRRFVATNSKGVDLRGFHWNQLLEELREFQKLKNPELQSFSIAA